MNNLNYKSLSIIFNRKFLLKLIHNNYKIYLKKILPAFENEKELPILSILDNLYREFKKNYRCEYVYKNAIVTKILLGRHSLNTTVMIPEFNVDGSKADLVMFNGTSTVYEIKTELDSLQRLEGQINSYLKCFDKVYVVTYEKNIEKIKQVVPNQVGIIILTERYTLKNIKKAKSNKKFVDPIKVYNILKEKERKNIIKEIKEELLLLPPLDYFKESKNLFLTFSPQQAHDFMVREIKNRKIKKEQKKIVLSAPESLKFFFLAESLNKKQCRILEEYLKKSPE